MTEQRIDVSEPAPRPRGQECRISIDDHSVWIDFTPKLQDEPHKPTKVELMAAGALMGIAGVLTGKAADEILAALVKFERSARKRRCHRSRCRNQSSKGGRSSRSSDTSGTRDS